MINFDPSWFTTTEGLLITLGTGLLLVVLIILLVSNSKKKKEVKIKENIAKDSNVETSVEQAPTVAAPVVEPMNVPVTEPVYVNNGQEGVAAEQQPIINAEPVSEVVIPSSVSVAEEVQQVAEPVVNTVPVIEIAEPIMENVQPEVENRAIPEVAGPSETVELEAMPVENISKVPEVAIPSVTPEVKIETSPSAYHGADPTVNSNFASQPVKPVIYGGADPLENTTTIPVVNSTIYNGVVPADTIKAQTPELQTRPVVAGPVQNELVIEEPKADLQVETPVENVAMPVEPAVESAPEYVAQEKPAQPEIELQPAQTNGFEDDDEEIETLEF